jgi:hypothetical protein
MFGSFGLIGAGLPRRRTWLGMAVALLFAVALVSAKPGVALAAAGVPGDNDGDGLGNWVERNQSGTDPDNADTDGDGLNDYAEYYLGLANPFVADTDGDGASDYVEVGFGSNPWDAGSFPYSQAGSGPDSDGDGLADWDETNYYGTEPKSFDTDGDGLSDGLEVNVFGTSPTWWSTDGDSVGDQQEILNGTDPFNPASF